MIFPQSTPISCGFRGLDSAFVRDFTQHPKALEEFETNPGSAISAPLQQQFHLKIPIARLSLRDMFLVLVESFYLQIEYRVPLLTHCID